MPFEPRESTWWISWFGRWIVMLGLCAVLGPGVVGLFQLTRSNRPLGAFLLLLWLPALFAICRALHRGGHVRWAVSIAATVVVLAVATWLLFAQ
jgi:putative effector of murein hydrolase LrgA (UPF0299 family)